MSSRRPGDSPSHCSPWRQVLELGERLFGLGLRALSHSVQPSDAIDLQQSLIQETAGSLFNARVSLWLDKEWLLGFSGVGEPPSAALMRQALQEGRAYGLQVSASAVAQALDDSSVFSGLCTLAMPLLIHPPGQGAQPAVGVLQIERSETQPFDEQDFDLLSGLATQAAIALHALQQMIEEHWRVDQLTLVQQVSGQISKLRDVDELSRQVTRLIQQTFKYYYMAIFTLETGQDELHFRASAGDNPSGYSPALAVHLGQGIIGYVAQNGQEILADDVQHEQRYRFIDVLPETRSEVALPLKIEDQVLGVLDVQSDQPHGFQESDLLVLRALAGHIASALESARLYSALRRRADQLSAVHELGKMITSILEQEKLLAEVVKLLQKHFDWPYVYIFSVHPGRRKIIYEAGCGALSQALQVQEAAYDLDDLQGLIPCAVRNAETLMVNDLQAEVRYQSTPLHPQTVRSELVVPLIFGAEVLGVLDVPDERLGAFNEEERFVFEALADHIAIALRNAALYRSEAWRRRAADSLREVAGLLSAEADVPQVLSAILGELAHTLPLDLAAIWLLEEMPGEEQFSEPFSELSEMGESRPVLHLACLHNAKGVGMELETGLTPEDVWEFGAEAGLAAQSGQADAWLLQALESDHPVIRSSDSPFEPLGAALGFPADYSAIAAPLRVGEQPLGVLTLAQRSPGRYGSESRAITAAFASYAAVAIENARLYEAAHEQAWVSTVLLQVSEATQTLVNLNELLETVIRIAPTLAGVKACMLYLADEDGAFSPAAAFGLASAQQVEFERWSFAPGDVPALDDLLAYKHPVIVREDADNLRLTTMLRVDGHELRSLDAGLLVLVPMLAHGEVLGAFLVDYSGGGNGRNGHRAFAELFDERLAIIQGIAHQTGIAIDNIRLMKSQKEEAYVSVALLQVAQAVVSSSDLNEALGSIVRITPILVGVRRAVVYLWDDETDTYHLAQSYGVGREAESLVYAPGEFPLLDAVRQEDRLMAYPLRGDEINSDDAPDIWSYLAAPDQDEVDLYLESQACLLLAFPLSIKGEVLGVFFIEEPDQPSGENFSGRNANQRLREKRLEIITGISQQAALAIQNDRLQREIVERERLEREMQLARDIQRAFLPHELPQLPGWDVQVRWRTARQVGGDFYDLFTLPDGRQGMVIADVADKGMPAALFMTLVRTLVRATVQGIDSPAQVLERVNDILVPDAPQGMFVTLVYLTLSLESGEVVYANAGHNLPIVLRGETCALESLQKGGMALGVMEGNHFQEFSLRLRPGDFLVLYTDGVTEAFDAGGDLYGEERLHNTLRQAAQGAVERCQPANLSAQELLDTIEQSVVTFMGDEPLSDDLTLLVLRYNPKDPG